MARFERKLLKTGEACRLRSRRKIAVAIALLASFAGGTLLTLAGCSGPPFKWIVSVSPTVFFISVDDEIFNLADAQIAYWLPSPKTFKALVEVSDPASGKIVSTIIESIRQGKHIYRIRVPDIDSPTRLVFSLYDISSSDQFIFQNRIETNWKPQRKWNISLIPSSHIDLYSTANAELTPEQHRRIIDTACDLCEAYPEYTFQLENRIPIYEYLDGSRSEEQVQRFINLVKTGRIDFGAQLTGVHQAGTDGESYARAQMGPLAFGRNIESELGIKPNFLAVYDTPGVMKHIPEFMKKAGVKYLVYAPNVSYRIQEMMSIPYIFYWQADSGAKALCWRSSYGYNAEKQDYFRLTSPDENVRESSVNRILLKRQEGLDDSGKPNPALFYPYDHYAILWDYGDNEPADSGPVDFVRQWNQKFAYPHFRISSYADFLEEMESLYASEIPTLKGELGNCWEFVLMNQGVINLYDRFARRALTQAHILERFTSIFHQSPPGIRVKAQEAWDNIAKIEAHDFFYGAKLDPETGELVPDFMNPDWAKAEWALVAERNSREALAESELAFASLIRTRNITRIVVINTLSFKRTAPAAVKLPDELFGKVFSLIEEPGGKVIPHQIIDAGTYEDCFGRRPSMKYQNDHFGGAYPDPERPSGKYAVFIACDIPPMGYRTYQLVEGQKLSEINSSCRASGNTISNEFYEVKINPATFAVSEIYDRELGRSLVDDEASIFGKKIELNQFLKGYPSLDSASILINLPFMHSNRSLWQPILDAITRSSVKFWEPENISGKLEVAANGPVMCAIRSITRDSRGSERRQTVVLFDKIKRIDFINFIKSTGCNPFERIAISFPFKMEKNFKARYESPYSIVTAGEDDLPGGPSPHRHACDWVEFEDGEMCISVATPDTGPFTFGRPDLNLVDDARYTKPEKPHYFPIVLDTCSWSAFVVPGSYTARFSISSSKAGKSHLFGRRESRSFCNQVLACMVLNNRGPLTPGKKSIIRVDKRNIEIATLKEPYEGEGIIVRIVEKEGIKTVARISVQKGIRIASAWVTGLDERPKKELAVFSSSVEVEVNPHEIVTLKLNVQKR